MDNSTRKWLVRAGSLLIVLGFFIPSVAVSCSASPGVTQSVSMNDLANDPFLSQPLLYLVLLGAITTLIAAFLLPRDRQQQTLYALGEIIGLGLGLLSILITLFSLSGKMQQAGFNVSLSAGSLILFFGYGMAAFGIFMEFTQGVKYAPSNEYDASLRYPPPVSPQVVYPPPQQRHGAHLKLAHGKAPSFVAINKTSFMIGRSHRNHLVLNDRQISSEHVVIKFANGIWFIQEKGSSNGTLVNGKRLQAQRLNDGDKIKMGNITYIFHA